MKKYRSTVVGIAIFVMMTLTLIGCDETMDMVKPIMAEPGEMESATNGSIRQPELTGPTETEEPSKQGEPTPEVPTEPAEPEVPELIGPITVEFTFYDGNMDIIEKVWKVFLPGNKKTPRYSNEWVGPLHVVVTFSHSLEELAHLKPKIFMTIDGKKALRFRSATGELASGTYIPKNTHSYLCKYAVPEGTFGDLRARVEVGGEVFTNDPPLHTLFQLCPIGPEGADTTDTSETGLIGRVFAPKPADHANTVSQPLPGVTLTILSGPRSGESTVSNENGYYRFRDIAEDELHLHVEKDCYEPKEVLVSRNHPTAIMPGRDVPNFDRSTDLGAKRTIPGNIVMGYAWPDPIRKLLEHITIPYDTLYFRGLPPTSNETATGIYAGRIGFVEVRATKFTESTRFLGTLAHELAHARQHAIVSIDGSESVLDWDDTPESIAYEKARQKDSEEFGDDKLPVDTIAYFRDKLRESSAEFISHFWLNTIMGYEDKERGDEYWNYELINPYEIAKTYAPHRLAWAKEWHEKTRPKN